MRVIKVDTKRDYIKLIPENADDLIFLSVFLLGARIGIKTIRRVKKYIGDRVVIEKKPVFIKMIVKDSEIDDFRKSLVVKGEVVETEGLSGEHSAAIEIGKDIEIWKKLSEEDLEEIKRLTTKEPEVLVVLIDRDTALIWKEKTIAEIENPKKVGKEEERAESYKEFFGLIKRVIKDNLGDAKVVVAGPGFVKEKLAKELEKDGLEVFVEHVSSVTPAGLRELFSRGILEKIIGKKRVEEEQKAIDEVFERIARNMPVAFGKDDVKRAVEEGNVKKLLISINLLKDKNAFIEAKQLINLVGSLGARVMILAKNEEAVKQLDGLGGIAAIKRW